MYLIFSPENCEYRGEGNTGLVINLKKEEKVLRLLKYDGNSKEFQNADELLRQMENETFMVKNVMKPLLGKELVNSPAIILLQAEDVKILNDIATLKRPRQRIHKSVKEERTYGLLLPDYCTLPQDLKVFPSFGPVLSIEIKPKPGFLLKETFLTSSLSEKSILLCHFCRKQVYKMKNDGILPKSSYCPTDLFSGCPTRMLHALKMLLQTPQNNIRIFKDQKLIFSEEKRNDLEDMLKDFFDKLESRCVDTLCNLVLKVLLKPFPRKLEENFTFSDKCDTLTCSNAHPTCSQNGDCHVLPTDCVLHRILRVQKLDKIGIQDVHSLLNKINGSNEQKSNYIGCYSRSEIPPYIGETEKIEKESDYQYASRKVWEFIVALVAKDCSIMLVLKNYTGRGNSHNPNLISDDYGKHYLFSIAVLDLDTKPLSRIEKHYKRTPLWLQACSSLPV